MEFVRSGQEGYIDPWDSRSAVAFIDAGTVSDIKPSYVRNCAFHHSYAPSVTAYGTNNLPIEWNVMADNVWFGKGAVRCSILRCFFLAVSRTWEIVNPFY